MTRGDVPDLPKALKRARKAAGFSNAKDFLAAIKASGRKAPSYSTYAQWESGEVTPRDETLDPIIEYHHEKKTWPEEPTDSDLASAIRDLTRELREAREERATLADRVEEMDAILKGLVGPTIADAEAPIVPRGNGQ